MLTILFADDEPNIRKLASFMLKSLGYNVIEAEDGEKALEIIKSDQNIDLVITDLIMPKIDGFAIAEAVGDEIPVIILSAMSDEFKPDIPFTKKAVDYITKPFNINMIKDHLALIFHKYGKNDSYQPKEVFNDNGLSFYPGENVLLVNKAVNSEQISTDLPILYYNKENFADFKLAKIIEDTASFGQTIMHKKGGIRIFDHLDLENNQEQIKNINRTNLALGNIVGLFLTDQTPSENLAKLFDRVIT